MFYLSVTSLSYKHYCKSLVRFTNVITFLNLTVTKYNSQVSGALFRDGLPNFQRYFKSDS